MARPRSDLGPRIVHAAGARFLREGVDGASLRAIAADAGTNIGMVYYYHPSKDDLFLAVVEPICTALLADLDRAVAPGRTVLDRLQALYLRMAALTADETEVMRLVIREALASSARLERLVDRFRRGHLSSLMILVRDAFAGGLYDPAVDPTLALAITALLAPAPVMLQAVQQRLGLPVAVTPSPPRMVEILLRGLGKTASKDRPRRPAAKGSPAAGEKPPRRRPRSTRRPTRH